MTSLANPSPNYQTRPWQQHRLDLGTPGASPVPAAAPATSPSWRRASTRCGAGGADRATRRRRRCAPRCRRCATRCASARPVRGELLRRQTQHRRHDGCRIRGPVPGARAHSGQHRDADRQCRQHRAAAARRGRRPAACRASATPPPTPTATCAVRSTGRGWTNSRPRSRPQTHRGHAARRRAGAVARGVSLSVRRAAGAAGAPPLTRQPEPPARARGAAQPLPVDGPAGVAWTGLAGLLGLLAVAGAAAPSDMADPARLATDPGGGRALAGASVPSRCTTAPWHLAGQPGRRRAAVAALRHRAARLPLAQQRSPGALAWPADPVRAARAAGASSPTTAVSRVCCMPAWRWPPCTCCWRGSGHAAGDRWRPGGRCSCSSCSSRHHGGHRCEAHAGLGHRGGADRPRHRQRSLDMVCGALAEAWRSARTSAAAGHERAPQQRGPACAARRDPT